MDRVILHCDCNSFFASVESIDHPEYKNVPMAVGGDEDKRSGIILARNELAKKYGVTTPETLYSARKKCPDLLIVSPHYEKYEEMCYKINEIYKQYTDRVEPFSIDESWLDVTGSQNLFGDGKTIADTLRKRVKEELGITISVGVSFNKTFAKMGSDYKKPDATTVITRENFKDLLWPLPIGDMLYVGKASQAAYRQAGINTIGDLANFPKEKITKYFGNMAIETYNRIWGHDDSEVALVDSYYQQKSISNDRTYPYDLIDKQEVLDALFDLSCLVASRLRASKFYTSTISIKIKNKELKVTGKQKTLKIPTNITNEIYEVCCELLDSLWNHEPIRMLSVGLTSFSDSRISQISIFEQEKNDTKQEALEKTMDEIRSKFGDETIKYARNKK